MRGIGSGQSLALRNRERSARRRQRQRTHGARDARAEHESFEQRVAGEPVSAVQPRCGDLAAGPQPGHRGRALGIRGNAAHVEVRGGRDRKRLARRVEARGPGDGPRAGKAFRQACDSGRVQEHGAAGERARGDAARDDVARREFGIGVDRRHEALSAVVEEQRPRAAQRLGQERLGIARDRERRRVKLHEFEVGEPHSAARRGGDARAACAGRVGRALEAGADPAGREHDLRRKYREPRAVRGLEQDAGRARSGRDDVHQAESLEHPDVRPPPYRRGERLHHRGAGAIAARVHDAVAAVARLAAQRKLAARNPVEFDAGLAQPGDAPRRSLGHDRRDFGQRQARGDAQGIGRVQGRGVARADRRGDAALREPRGAIAEGRAGSDDAAVERERGREARDAAADHDGGRRDDVVGDHGLTASIRVTARRARSAMAAGTFTS